MVTKLYCSNAFSQKQVGNSSVHLVHQQAVPKLEAMRFLPVSICQT